MFKPEEYGYVFTNVEAEDDLEKIKTVSKWTIDWLEFQKICQQKGSVVFDIDHTLIDKNENIIQPVFEIYKKCSSFGFAVNIVTARPKSKINFYATKLLLNRLGVSKYEKLYMMPSSIDATFENVSSYKLDARNQIATRHKLLANIGDQWSDLSKFPSVDLNIYERDLNECVVCFFPQDAHPSIKLPVFDYPERKSDQNEDNDVYDI
jgi:hypothetical protein